MIDKTFADRFAADWIASWNSHDLDRILSHYSDDFEFSSPFIAKIAGEASGRLKGKAAIRSYWSKGLTAYPDLKFELIATLAGVTSVTIYYKAVAGKRAAEVFEFGETGKVIRSSAHYDS